MSDITFDCPECAGHLVVDEKGAGMTVPCPECGKPISVPRLTTPPPPSTVPSAKQHKRNVSLNKACVIVIVALIVGVGLGYVLGHQTTAGADGIGNVTKAVGSPFTAGATTNVSVIAKTTNDVVQTLLSKVNNPHALSPTEGGVLGAALWKTDADMQLDVEPIQKTHQDKVAVDALLKLLREEKSDSESDHKVICFMATRAIALLAPSSPEAMNALKQLQSSKDDVIASQAKLQMIFVEGEIKRATESAPRELTQ